MRPEPHLEVLRVPGDPPGRSGPYPPRWWRRVDRALGFAPSLELWAMVVQVGPLRWLLGRREP